MNKSIKYLLLIFIYAVLFGCVAIFSTYKYYSKDLPDVHALKEVKLQTPLQIFSADNELIAVFGEQRRLPLTYEKIPQQLINAITATEDARFFEHYGIDPVGIVRALWVAIKSDEISQGGSTITQQLAKNFFLTPEKTISRKIKEIMLAFRIEKVLNKQEIITLYLNKIYLGSRSYGVGAAAYTYFGKKIDELTLSQIATIAGLPKAPSNYNPIYAPERSIARRNWVLNRMLGQQFISQAEYDEAIDEPLVAHHHSPNIEFKAPYVSEMVRQHMFNKFGSDAYANGYNVYTTVTRKKQLAAIHSLQENIINYDMRHGYRGASKVLWNAKEKAWSNDNILAELKKTPVYSPLHPAIVTKATAREASLMMAGGESITLTYKHVAWARRFLSDTAQSGSPKSVSHVVKSGQLVWVRKVNNEWLLAQIPEVNSALVSINATDGSIEALVGGFNFQLSNFNRATQSARQIGSNIKPFIYAASLNKGLTMASVLNDTPIVRRVANNKVWAPRNSPNVYAGPLRLRVGFGLSKNMMVIRAMHAVGVNYAAEYLTRFGFPAQNISRTESLALGSASFSPLQLVRGYAAFDNGGFLVTPHIISRIDSAEGKTLYKASPLIAHSSCPLIVDDSPIFNDQSTLIKHIEKDIQSDDIVLADDDPQLDEQSLSADSLIDEQTLNAGNELDSPPQLNCAPHIISEDIAFLIKSGLKSNIWGESGSGWRPTGLRARVLARQDIGGKTGTTNKSKDAWFTGFGDNIVTSVWMGFDNHRRSLGRSSQTGGEDGSRAALPAWISYMKVALKDRPVKKEIPPENIIKRNIDRSSGRLASRGLPEFFIKGTEPKVAVYVRETSSNNTTSERGTAVMDNRTGTVKEVF